MKLIILKFGVLSVLINALFIFGYWGFVLNKPDFKMGMIIGYTGMFISLSVIFIALNAFSKQQSTNGVSFGIAFATGLLIALISAFGYALCWLLLIHNLYPSFFEDYAVYEMAEWRSEGLSEAELLEHTNELIRYRELYKNPFLGFFVTMSEMLPMGIAFALIAALIFKKKPIFSSL